MMLLGKMYIYSLYKLSVLCGLYSQKRMVLDLNYIQQEDYNFFEAILFFVAPPEDISDKFDEYEKQRVN